MTNTLDQPKRSRSKSFGFRATPTERGFNLFAVLALVFLYIPIVTVVVLSFNSSKITYRWEGFTTDWYPTLFEDTALLSGLQVSLIVGVASAFLATLVGLMTGLGLQSMSGRIKVLVLGGLFLPLVVPELVLGVSLLTLFSDLGIPLGYTSLILGHIVVTMPYSALIVVGSLQALDPSLDEAAIDLGCTRWSAFTKVTLPLLAPSLGASVLLCFTISFSNIVMSSFVNGVGTTTLPLRVYSMLKTGLPPTINALGTLLIAGTLVLILVVGVGRLRDIMARSSTPVEQTAKEKS